MATVTPGRYSSKAAVPLMALLSRRPDFALTWIWWLTFLSTILQMVLNLTLLRREFRLKLA